MTKDRLQSRPVFLNLLRIRQPVTAIASIAHRISGVLLFLAIPLMIWMVDRSLAGPQGYAEVAALLEGGAMKLLMLLLGWAAAHHFFAGVRFLLLDVDVGIDLATARKTAMAVNALGVAGVVITLAVVL